MKLDALDAPTFSESVSVFYGVTGASNTLVFIKIRVWAIGLECFLKFSHTE